MKTTWEYTDTVDNVKVQLANDILAVDAEWKKAIQHLKRFNVAMWIGAALNLGVLLLPSWYWMIPSWSVYLCGLVGSRWWFTVRVRTFDLKQAMHATLRELQSIPTISHPRVHVLLTHTSWWRRHVRSRFE